VFVNLRDPEQHLLDPRRRDRQAPVRNQSDAGYPVRSPGLGHPKAPAVVPSGAAQRRSRGIAVLPV